MKYTSSTNVFSVDLEDWYQGLEIDINDWGRFEPRIHQGLVPLLELLNQRQVKATFFVLGYQAEQTPELITRIANDGHEIASHGYSHRFVYQQTPNQFRTELKRSKDFLEQLTAKEVVGYRAPFFSITEKSLWALDILLEEGFLYDSSIFPVRNYRYGIKNAVDEPQFITTPNGQRIFEIPLSTLRLPSAQSRQGFNFPASGGGYFRLYPYWLSRSLISRLLRREKTLVFYVHPWEYDHNHPRIAMPRKKAQITHYLNLSSTLPKTKKLLEQYQFGTIEHVFSPQYLKTG